MNIDYAQMITAEQKQLASAQALLAAAIASRRAAYVQESDPLKTEADYDAQVSGNEPDYSAWLAAVVAIKQRYPLPADAVA